MLQGLITGCGDAFSARHFGSSMVLSAPRGYVLIDCPDPIHRILHEAKNRSEQHGCHAFSKLDANSITDVVLTHLHGDHCNGIESLGFWRRLQQIKDTGLELPRLWLEPDALPRLWRKLEPIMAGSLGRELNEFFQLCVLPVNGEATIAGLQVETRRTTHTMPCLALRVNHAQHSLGWSADTGFDEELLDWLFEAQLVVHEAGGGPPAHTSLEQLAELSVERRMRLWLSHLPDQQRKQASQMGFRMTEEGQVLTLEQLC